VHNQFAKHEKTELDNVMQTKSLPSMVFTATGIGFLSALSLKVAAYTQPKWPAREKQTTAINTH